MPRFLSPKADIVFKKIFGDNPPLLKSLLNALLPLPTENLIAELEHLPAEQVPVIPGVKRTVVDVKCRDKNGHIFIVEMQINWSAYFKQRLLFSSSQAYVKQLESGEDYQLLQPVYGLALIGSIFDHDSPLWYHHYRLVNVEKPKQEVIEGLQLVFIELPKFSSDETTQHHYPLRTLWLRFMQEINEKTKVVPPELLAVPEIRRAIELAEEAAYSLGELELYESYWKGVSSEKTLVKDGFNKGKAEGKAEGLAELDLIAKKREEQKAVEIAREMRKEGMEIAFIAKMTQLPVAIIEELP